MEDAINEGAYNKRMLISHKHYALGLDAGGSSLKWVLLSGTGQYIARGRLGPLTTSLLLNGSGAEVLRQLSEKLPYRPDVVIAGFPGLSRHTIQAEQVADFLSTAVCLPTQGIRVVSDLELAYHAHLQPGQGILLYAGTGSMALHIAKNGDFMRVGGYGYKISDDGGGFGLGRAVLRWLTNAFDTRPQNSQAIWTSPLAEEVKAITGGLDWETLRTYIYSEPGAASVATLAPAVGAAADRGDQVAMKLLKEACKSLVQLVEALFQRIGKLPVVATGGVFYISKHWQCFLQDELSNAAITICQQDHAEYAARWALRDLGKKM